MLDVTVQNIRVLRDFHLMSDGKFTIVVGTNESGKTSLAQAINFALTGTMFGLKGKDVKTAVSHGEDRMSVSLRVGDRIHVHRTTSTGDPIKTIAQRLGVDVNVLPLLFDAKMVGDGGNKSMKAFLVGAGTERFDPLAHFVNDPSVRPYIEQANNAGKRETAHIVKFCTDMRAAQKAPPEPVRPATIQPSEADRATAYANYQNAQGELANRRAIKGDVVKSTRALSSIYAYLTNLKSFEESMKAASVTDPLGERRSHLTKVISVDTLTLQNLATILTNAGFSKEANDARLLQSLVDNVISSARQELANNLPPAPPPVAPQFPDEHRQLYDVLKEEGHLTPEGMRERMNVLTRDEAEAQKEMETATANLTQTENYWNQMQQSSGAWAAYLNASKDHGSNTIRIKEEWNRWDYAAKAIQEAEEEYLRATGNRFADLVSQFSADLLQGRKVRIDREEGIFLGNVPIDACSDSTKWRIEVSVMAAVAIILRSPLLIIDGADVLDCYNKSAMLTFIRQKIVPKFEHVLLTSTMAGTPEQEQAIPANVTATDKWILQGGQAHLLPQSSPTPPPPPPPPPLS